MKNKRRCSVKYTLTNDARSSDNSIIHRRISMLLTGICGTTAGAVVPWLNGSAGVHKRELFRWNGMTRLNSAIVTSLLYSKKNMAAAFCERVDV